MKRFFLLFLLATACSPGRSDDLIKEYAKAFFDNYETRKDWQAFQNMYAEDMVFEDVVFRIVLDKPGFIEFYNWPDSLLKKHPDYDKVMVLEDLTTTDSTAIGRGHFNPFYYGEKLYDQKAYMRFTMALHFNKEGKITRHIDFIEYAPEFLIGLAERHLNQDKENF